MVSKGRVEINKIANTTRTRSTIKEVIDVATTQEMVKDYDPSTKPSKALSQLKQNVSTNTPSKFSNSSKALATKGKWIGHRSKNVGIVKE